MRSDTLCIAQTSSAVAKPFHQVQCKNAGCAAHMVKGDTPPLERLCSRLALVPDGTINKDGPIRPIAVPGGTMVVPPGTATYEA